MKNNDKSFWQSISNTWKTRAIFVFVVLWIWFMIVSTFGASPQKYDWYISENEMILSVFGSIVGLVGYFIGLFWVLKKCSTNYNSCTHWINLIIQRTLYGLICLVISCVATGILFAINVYYPMASAVFGFLCVLSLIIAFIISGLFIKQSLITEANIKAQEMYNGKKRSLHY